MAKRNNWCIVLVAVAVPLAVLLIFTTSGGDPAPAGVHASVGRAERPAADRPADRDTKDDHQAFVAPKSQSALDDILPLTPRDCTSTWFKLRRSVLRRAKQSITCGTFDFKLADFVECSNYALSGSSQTAENIAELVRDQPDAAFFPMMDGGGILCHSCDDHVCEVMRHRGHFEVELSTTMLRVLNRLKAEVRRAGDVLLRRAGIAVQDFAVDSVEYIDVGGNLGSHLLRIMSHGYPARVVEAMFMNQHNLKFSRCLNERHYKRLGKFYPPWSLVQKGLTDTPRETPRCWMVSSVRNVGNGVVTCNETRKNELMAHHDLVHMIHDVREEITMTSFDDEAETLKLYERPASMSDLVSQVRGKTLDPSIRVQGSDLLAPDVSNEELIRFVSRKHFMMKIDVEGYEEKALTAAKKFLTSDSAPVMITSEINDAYLPDVGRFIRLMESYGYKALSEHNWEKAPAGQWDHEELSAMKYDGKTPKYLNVMFMRKDLRHWWRTGGGVEQP